MGHAAIHEKEDHPLRFRFEVQLLEDSSRSAGHSLGQRGIEHVGQRDHAKPSAHQGQSLASSYRFWMVAGHYILLLVSR